MSKFRKGDKVIYLDIIPHSSTNWYNEWEDLDPKGNVGVVTDIFDNVTVGVKLLIYPEFDQSVHPDNLHLIEIGSSECP